MKQSITHYALVFSLLTAGLLFIPALDATAKLTKSQVKRCLGGRFSIRANETAQVFDPTGTFFLGTIPFTGKGRIRIGPGSSVAGGNRYSISRLTVRGRNKIVAVGGTQDVTTVNRLLGSLRIVVTKKRGQAKITSGRYSWGGQNPISGNIFVASGRMTGSKKLSKACQH